MTEQHPITPCEDMCAHLLRSGKTFYEMLTEAARWGADQELDACCEWLQDPDLNVDTYKLRTARRPKPPSLAEEALFKLGAMEKLWDACGNKPNGLIRRALERLQELENNG